VLKELAAYRRARRKGVSLSITVLLDVRLALMLAGAGVGQSRPSSTTVCSEGLGGARATAVALRTFDLRGVIACAFGVYEFYHDSAAALLVELRTQSQRAGWKSSRARRHDARFPEHAIPLLLAKAELNLDDLDHVVFFEKAVLKIRGDGA